MDWVFLNGSHGWRAWWPSNSKYKKVHNLDKGLNHVRRERSRQGERTREHVRVASGRVPIPAHFAAWPLFLALSNGTPLKGRTFLFAKLASDHCCFLKLNSAWRVVSRMRPGQSLPSWWVSWVVARRTSQDEVKLTQRLGEIWNPRIRPRRDLRISQTGSVAEIELVDKQALLSWKCFCTRTSFSKET